MTDTAGSITDTTRTDLGDGWRAVVHHSWDLPAALLDRWEALVRAYGDRGLFLRPGWARTWWSVFGTGGRLHLTVLSRGDDVRGIVPCWITPDGRLTGLANEVYFDALVEAEDRPEVLRRFLQAIDGLPWRRADLQYLSRLEPNTAALQDVLRQTGRRFWTWDQAYGPKVDLRTPTWDDLEAGFHSKLRNNLKKGRRRAEKEGTLSFEEARDPARLEAVLDEAFAVEGSGWKARDGTAIVLHPQKDAWYRGISRWAASEGILRVYLLRLNGRLIAFDLDFEVGRTVFALKTGFDEQVATRFSPGNLMRHEVIHRLYDTPGIDTYDFLGETFPWKLEWTPNTDTCTDVFLYPRGLGGALAYLREHGWKQPVKRITGVFARAPQPQAPPADA